MLRFKVNYFTVDVKDFGKKCGKHPFINTEEKYRNGLEHVTILPTLVLKQRGCCLRVTGFYLNLYSVEERAVLL